MKKISVILAAMLLCATAANYAADSPEENAPHFASMSNGGANLLLAPSLFSGESATSYPIAVLPAAGKIEDKVPLTLQYRGGNANSWLGKGWEFNPGYIDRPNKFGFNNAANPYVLNLNGSAYELVSIATNQYRTKNETNLRIEFTGSLWQVWTRDGTLYKFEIANGTRWFLTRITDTHGLSIVIDYDRPTSTEAYPKEIRYPEGQGLTPYCKISFISETRADTTINYSYPSPVEIKKRLKEIQLIAGTYLQKKYVLNYGTNGQSQVSLLTSITEYGKDGTALPPTSFEYNLPKGASAFATQSQLVPEQGYLYPSTAIRSEDYVGEISPGLNMALVDMNGDGLPDLVGCRKYDPSGLIDTQTEWIVYLNSVNGFSTTPVVWLPMNYAYFLVPSNTQYQYITLTNLSTLADINGDGLPDLVYSKHGGQTGLTNVGIYDLCVRYNTGIKFSDTETVLLPYTSAYYSFDSTNVYAIKAGSTALLIDVNGDGKADLVYNRFKRNENYVAYDTVITKHPLFDWVVRLNTGNGFETTERLYLDAEQTYFEYSLHAPHAYGGTPSTVLRNYIQKITVNSNSMLVDVNGDGLPDLVYNDFSAEVAVNPSDTDSVVYAPSYNWKVRLNTGTKFSDIPLMFFAHAPVDYYRMKDTANPAKYTYKNIPVCIKNNGLITDVNNDGLPDLVFNNYATGSKDTGTTDWWPNVTWLAAYNTGTAFQTSPQPFTGPAGYDVTEMTGCYYEKKKSFVTTNNAYVADIDGDAAAEIVFPQFNRFGCAIFKFSLQKWETTNPSGVDLLSKITTPYGGQTSITYTGTGRFNNSGSDGKPDLPFTLPVVASMTTVSGTGANGTTAYSYEGGWYDSLARQFRGFRHAQVTDPLGFVSHTYYLQDDSRLGSVEISQNPETTTTNTYLTDTTAPYYTPVIQVDETTGTKTKRTNFEYDSYGNAIKTIQSGDSAVTGDEKTVLTDYMVNPGLWIVDRPARERVFPNGDGSGSASAETQLVYDANTAYTSMPTKGDLTKTLKYWNTKGTYINTSSTYDVYGNELSKTDANNNKMTFDYDASYQAFITKTTNPKTQAVQYTYYTPDASAGLFGQLKSTLDPNNSLTAYEYDTFGRKKKTIGPYDSASAYGSESYEYGIGGPGADYIMTRTTENPGTPDHLIKIDILDGFERVVQRSGESEDSGVFSYTTTDYNPRGEIARTSLPYFKDGGLRLSYLAASGMEKWISTTYDALGRPLTVTKADGTAINNAYSGWTTTVTDEKAHVKTYTNDAYGRLSTVKERIGAQDYTTTYSYDALDDLARITDSAGNKIDYTYDALGRKTKMIDPDMGTWTYDYDNNGNMVKSVDGRGITITSTYDSLNRILTKDYSDVSGIDVTYVYDETASSNAIGKRSSMRDMSGSSRWHFDLEGRTVKLEKTIDSVLYPIEWTYDGLDRVKSLKYPNGKIINYTFNNAGLAETIDGYVYNASYDAARQPVKIDFTNAITSYFTYIPENLRLKSIISGSLQDLSYDYDTAGNVVKITDLIHGLSKSYQYDDLNRLLNGDGEVYAYNPAGNIVTHNSAAYQYGTRPHAVTNDGTFAYTYDSCGNMLTGAGRTITYDAENRPIRIDFNGISTTFKYDGDGKRTKKVVTGGSGSVTTVYLEDLYEKDIVQ